MGRALIFKDADFSQNALRKISFATYTWEDLVITNAITHKDGYIYGSISTTNAPAGTVETNVSVNSWGGAWGYTDLIEIPQNATRIRGILSEIDLILSNQTQRSYFPMIVFYDSNNNYISEVNSYDFEEVNISFYYEDSGYKTRGYKGLINAAIPDNATQLRVQWVAGRSGNDTISEKMGDTTPIRINLPTYLEYGTPRELN